MKETNKKLIATSTDEDLRQKDWKLEYFKLEGDILVQNFLTPEGKKLEVRTRFCKYDNAFGAPEISTQMIYELDGGDTLGR